MTNLVRFPRSLLRCPWEERLRFFYECKIPHERMETVITKVVSAIRRRAGEGLIMVTGPTRIGKTTVLAHLVNRLLTESMDEMLKNPGHIPVAWMEAAAYPRGYDWKDHWVGSLIALNEPLIEYKVLPSPEELRLDPSASDCLGEIYAARILRRSFQEAARQRRLRVFCIDEAQHLTLVPYAKMYRTQLEIIKSVANHSNAMHVLFGTYDLLKLRNASGQLGSRTVTIHFNRYRADSKPDLLAFANALISLTGYMPLDKRPDLSKDLDYCFETCLGCIGLLKVWFLDTLGAVLEEGRQTLTRRDLEKHEPPVDVLDKISLEILEGEEQLEQDETKRELIKRRMRNGKKNLSSAVETLILDVPSQKKIIKKNSRVERKPTRDKAGEGRNKSALKGQAAIANRR